MTTLDPYKRLFLAVSTLDNCMRQNRDRQDTEDFKAILDEVEERLAEARAAFAEEVSR